MPRNYQDPIRSRQMKADTPRPVSYDVTASPVDTFVAPKRTNGAIRLAESLSGLNTNLSPMVEEALTKEAEARYNQGMLAKTKGEEAPKDAGERFMDGYMAMSGKLKGDEDAAWLRQEYETNFDKTNGDSAAFDAFVQQKLGERMQGMDDPAFLKVYSESFLTSATKLRQEHLDNSRKEAVALVESNAMDMLTGMVKSYADNGMPVDDVAIDDMRKFLNKDMGVTNSRYNELLFTSIKRLGDEGNFAIYDTLKKSKPDGTPGMYSIPEWREKIDAAQIHAQRVFLAKRENAEKEAKEQREEAQDAALLDVFLEPDPKKASALFDDHVKRGLFTNASDLYDWRKKMEEHVDGKPNVQQQELEVGLLTKIIQRKTTTREILSAPITLSQRRYLLNELEQAKRHDQNLAKDKGNDIYKSMEFRSGEEYIKATLASTPNQFDIFGHGTDFERQQRASAVMEFTRRAKGVTDPLELNAIREEIVERYQKRRRTMGDDQKAVPGAGLIRYSTLAETKKNADKMSVEELQVHVNYFKNQKSQIK